jgi:hypothetical protein
VSLPLLPTYIYIYIYIYRWEGEEFGQKIGNLKGTCWEHKKIEKNHPPHPKLKRKNPKSIHSSMWPCKNISHIQVLVYLSFRTPPIKLKLGLQTDGETTNLTLLIRLFQGSRPGLWNPCMFPGSQHSCSEFIGFYYNTISNQRFRVQGHILSVGGNALKVSQAGLSMWSSTNKIGWREVKFKSFPQESSFGRA